MTITPHSASIHAPSEAMAALWCVVEHRMTLAADQPPELVYIGTCKLIEAFKLTTARTNSEWVNLAKGNRPVMVTIIATGDRRETYEFATRHVRSLATTPRCNLHGYITTGRARPIICSNGIRYNTQQEAADALGISQGQISNHLRGIGGAVKGLTFAWVDV